MCRPRHSLPRFSVCTASPVRTLWGGDELGVPDTVSGCVGQKAALGDATRNVFLSSVPQIALGAAT
jgi:hypothetical protein